MWYVSCLCESVSRPRELGDDCWHLMVFTGCPTFCVWPRGYLRYSYMATKAQHKCIANLYLFHTTPWGHADSGWMLDHSILGVYFPCYKFKLRLWPAAQLIFFSLKVQNTWLFNLSFYISSLGYCRLQRHWNNSWKAVLWEDRSDWNVEGKLACEPHRLTFILTRIISQTSGCVFRLSPWTVLVSS